MRVDAGSWRRWFTFDRRILLRALSIGLPPFAVAALLLWTAGPPVEIAWSVTVALVLLWIGSAHAVRRRVVNLLRVLSNMLAAVREGDYSIRARGARRDDPHGDLLWEINALTQWHQDERFGERESATLLRKIMQEIDVAIFTFDGEHRLRSVNRAGERLLARPMERVHGIRAERLGLEECLAEHAPAVLDRTFPGGDGRWEVRRSEFRQGGRPMRLLVLSDVRRALREEERQTWQRLIRVLGHELNNSLTPIRSIGGSLRRLIDREDRPDDWESDLRSGLEVIASRSESLIRFMDAYARLARLPPPELGRVELGVLVRRVVDLETRLTVELEPGPEATVAADGDQIEQLLINVVRNAVDAALETGGDVRVGWGVDDVAVEIWVRDEGPGLATTSNLFVPFFTTKPGGSGIGLVISRQIAEAHGGTLVLENRRDRRGCEARLRLVP